METVGMRKFKKNQTMGNSRFAALISGEGDFDLPYCNEDPPHVPPSTDHPVLSKSIAQRQKMPNERMS